MTDLAKVWDKPEVTCPVSALGQDYPSFDLPRALPLLAQARREAPVFYAPDLGYWVVTRYEDVLSILRQPEIYSAANANTPIQPLPPEALQLMAEGGYALEGVQVNCDPPRHGRIRASAAQAMGMKRLMGMEPLIQHHVDEAIAALKGQDEAELMTALTRDLPARVIFALLGFPEDDLTQLKAWAHDRLLLSFSRPSPEQQMEAARNLTAFWRYCVAQVAAKAHAPAEDYVSDLLALRGGDDAVLTLNEINSLAFGLLFAGHETTTSQMTNTIAAVLAIPGLWARMATEPAIIPGIVEEGLRLYGAVSHWRRICLTEVTLGGVVLPAGTQLLLSFASANRDEARFPAADQLDPTRPDAHRHLTFGHGIHVCLGAPLARLEMRVLLTSLSRAFPQMRLAEAGPPSLEPTFAFRAPTGLSVRLSG